MAPFDSGLVTKISPLIEGQVPDFIQSDHPVFVEFLKQYYQFLEAAELTVDGIINNVIQETTSTNYIWAENETRIVLEEGVGTTGKFIEGETITGGTSSATATVLVDDLSNATPRLFISSQQKFELGETITGATSGATATVNTYRANPVQTIQQLLDYANTDNTTALMLDEMQRQFMDVIPSSLASGVSKRNLIKNIKDLYTAKGTSEGHKLFLRLMFDEEADIFYPTKYMLRTSDGNWNKPTTIRCENAPGASGREVIGQTLTGLTSGATIFVVNAVELLQGAFSVTEFEIDIDTLVGTFVEGETLFANGVNSDVEQRFTIQKIVTGVSIEEGGTLYNVGDTITLDSTVGNGLATAKVNTVSVGGVTEAFVDTGGSNYREGDDLVFTGTSAAVSAAGHVSVIGGALLSEDSDNSDGYNDYIILEEGANVSYPEFNISTHEQDIIVLNGTDSSSTDANWRIISEYASPRLRVPDTTSGSKIVEELGTSSTYGEIAGINLTSSGSGYDALPTITITSTYGTGGVIVPTTNDIGTILDTEIIDSGFLYRTAPTATVPTNLVLKDVSGTFTAANSLSSHTGTVTSYDSSAQILSTSIDDTVKVKMEQENTTVSQNIEQEENTEVVFSRIIADGVLESNTLKNLTNRGLDLDDVVGVAAQTSPTRGFTDRIVADADDTRLTEISFQQNADYSIDNEKIQLEDQHITGDNDDTIILGTDLTRMNTYNTDGMKLLLDSSAGGFSILIEDGGTDGSGTNAGDEILLDRTASGGADAGDKVLYESDDDGDAILFEPHPMISNITQRRDKFVLDGTRIQRFTTGGWIDEDRITNESLEALITNSQPVWVPPSAGDDIILENEHGNLLLDGTSTNVLVIVTSLNTVHNKTLDNGDKVKTEGRSAYFINEPVDSFRLIDDIDGVQLEDSLQFDTTTPLDLLILEGPDGFTATADRNGFYDIFENKTISHGGSSGSRVMTEGGDGIIDEESTATQIGAGDRMILDSHQISSDDETIRLVFNQTDSSGSDEGGVLIADGLSVAERTGNLIMQESGLAAGEQDTDLGDNLLYEPESFLTGNIILDRTDDDDSDLGDELITETADVLVGQTLTTSLGATGKIISSSTGKLSAEIGFTTTNVGLYKNTDSLISEDVVRIQDSYYYQDFSYEVKIGQSVSKYMNELKRAVHPAGFASFGKVSIATLLSMAMPTSSGEGRIDVPSTTFTPALASVLETIFDLEIKLRLDIPKVFEQGNAFQKLMLETGAPAQFNVAIDGTDFGTKLETGSGGGSSVGSGFGVIASEESEDEGDNILITGSDDGSQEDAGDQIILEGTDASGTDNFDITGEYSFLILNGTSVSEGELNDAGSYCILSGSALGVYNLVDADSDSLVLNGTDGSGTFYKIVHEDGDHAGSNIITDSIVESTTLVETGGPIEIESSLPNIRGPYVNTEDGHRIVTENFAETLVDGPVISVTNQKIISEDPNGDNIILNGTNLLGDDANSKLVSEAAAGVGDNDRDKLFLRQLTLKVTPPRPRVLTSYGLVHMAEKAFSDASSVTNIQLEDGLRKRGPTINSDQLVLDGVDVGEKDDVNDILYGGDPVQMETSAATMLGTSITFDDYAQFYNYSVILNGTDGSSTNAGGKINLDSPSGGSLVSEDQIISFPMNEFLRPDIMIMEGYYDRHSEWGRFVLDGTASDNSLGAVDDGSFIVLDGIDVMASSSGDNLILEEQNDINKSYDDGNNVGILMESHHIEGGYIQREWGGGDVSLGDMIVLDGTDSSSTDAEDNIIQEDTPDSRVTQNSGDFMLETDAAVYMTLEASDANLTDYGTVIGLEDATGAIVNETAAVAGHDIILEAGSSSTIGSKLILDSQLIEIESGINDGEIPSTSFGDNSIFPTYSAPATIATRPTGRVFLQDESPSTLLSQEGDTGDDLLLNGTRTEGAIALNGTNSSSADENSPLVLDGTELGYDRMTLETGSYIILETVAHGQILNESTLTTIDIENVGDKVLHEDCDHVDAGDYLLVSAEILDQAPGGFMIFNGTDGSSTNAGSSVQLENGTYSSLLGTALAYLPRGQEAESFDNSLRTTFDSTGQTYDVLEGV